MTSFGARQSIPERPTNDLKALDLLCTGGELSSDWSVGSLKRLPLHSRIVVRLLLERALSF